VTSEIPPTTWQEAALNDTCTDTSHRATLCHTAESGGTELRDAPYSCADVIGNARCALGTELCLRSFSSASSQSVGTGCATCSPVHHDTRTRVSSVQSPFFLLSTQLHVRPHAHRACTRVHSFFAGYNLTPSSLRSISDNGRIRTRENGWRGRACARGRASEKKEHDGRREEGEDE
jgi:hypothetical protein